MKIGIISDTHDNHPLIHEAIRLFSLLEVELVLHAGDITTPSSLILFSDLPCRVIGVFGNCDRRQTTLLKKTADTCANISLQGSFLDVTIDELRIGMVHGDDTLALIALAEGTLHDVIISGHTHRPSIRGSGSTIFINPGEACGERYGEPTVAVFDTEARRGDILPIRYV
ncbi:MAG: metallophosphoesterase [Methanocalculus sp.]|uniref:metallophosphoesterase n=1 Tax=Methanocalculus sp. TaxID=2004547 RepID=UPI00271BC36E|nr:metallophosphoesterase [Methanocalculus sp.]MDO9538417.1 metallophosphoesterase [Methanocalculus sp.]